MPIYLVRWPDLSASFVQAEGEAHLLDVLYQVGNPDDCEWSIYDGPLFIDFRLPVEWSVQEDRHRTPVAPEQVVLEDVGRLASGNVVEAIELSLAGADDGYETGAEVLRLAFPKLHALIERCSETVASSTARQRFRKRSFDRRCMLNLSDSCEDPGAVPNLKEKPMGFPGLRGRWTCRSNSRVPTKR